VLWRRRGSNECNTTPGVERFLRPDGSVVLAVNWPEDGSDVPEEPPTPFPVSSPPSPAEDDSVLAGGAEELVSVGEAEPSEVVPLVAAAVEAAVELVAVAEYVKLESVEVSVELASVAVDVLVLVELSEELLASVDVELAVLVQLDTILLISVSLRPERSPAGTKHVVVVFAIPVTFEKDEVSVRLEEFEAETAVELEAIARHAGGIAGMSLEGHQPSYVSCLTQVELHQLTKNRALQR
jgi:hypothetical protein